MIRNIRTRPAACASSAFAVVALVFSPALWALGLGDAKVESYLNQPLRARIDLVTQASDDLSSVTAQLASAADYALIGASRESVSVPIRFTIENVDGDAYIAATSSLPIGDPVLRLIVEVNWSNGRMLREYTLFLDPPTVAERAPAPRIDKRQPPVATATPEPSGAAREQAAEPAAARTPAGGEYGPVRSGETLWAIAREWSRGTGVTINQAMIAIQRENPRAFARDNINLLKLGAILRMPDLADVEAISASAARRDVMDQEVVFKERKSGANAASTETPLLADDRADLTGDSAAAAPEPAEPAASEQPAVLEAAEPEAAAGPEEVTEAAAGPVGARDQLELIPPSAEEEPEGARDVEESGEATGAEGNVQTLRETLARTEEELINQQQQNTYLEDRIRELEAQLESAQKEGVADADLANMEARLRQERQAAAAEEAERSWYGRKTMWLIGLLVAVVAFAGWLLSRRGQAAAESGAPLRDIKHEAEDVLRVLSDDTAKKPEPAAARVPVQPSGGPETAVDTAARSPGAAGDDAELLDEESSDPEIQLDLARAYISMGDKEAARVILQEVVTNGSEGQQAEARKMLDLLA